MHRTFPVLTLVLGLVVGSSVAVAYAAGGIDMFADVFIDGTLTVQDGTQGFGKVFTSDGAGTGSWQGPPEVVDEEFLAELDVRITALENPPPIQKEIVYSQIMIVDPIITGQVGNLMHTIPDNAVITNMECPMFDDDATGSARCTLYKKDAQGTRTTVQAISTTVPFNGGDITLSANPNETVERETFDYYFEFTSSSCGACIAKSAKLTYTE